jgi:hypothetical protein
MLGVVRQNEVLKIFIMPSAVMLSVNIMRIIVLCVFLLSVVMLCVIMLSVVMVNVAMPSADPIKSFICKFTHSFCTSK